MTTKEYLGQIIRLDANINNKLSELTQAKELACSISAISYEERVQTTPNFDKIGTALCKIEKMQEEINRLVDRYVDKKTQIVEQIETMENDMHYKVLFKRYVEGKTFEKIAIETTYSFRQIIRIHGRALQGFEKKYGEIYLV